MSLKTHREPVADCPQPDARALSVTAQNRIAFEMWWRDHSPDVMRVAAQADTQRLDWLSSQPSPLSIYKPSGDYEATALWRGNSAVYELGIRAAIDAARKRWPEVEND